MSLDSAIDQQRVVFNLNGVNTNYAPERLTLGGVTAGVRQGSISQVTVLVENFVTAATIELWLPRIVSDPNLPASSFGDGDYFNSGSGPLTAAGMGNWFLGGWPGAQIRVKSGANVGQMTISASCS